jgi:hypothetical protein
MGGPMGFFQYNSDDTNVYKVKLDASNAGEFSAAASTTDPWYPRGWQLRYVLAENATYGRRKVPCPDLTSAIWLGTSDTINLQVAGVAGTVAFTVTGRFGEKRTSRG